MAEHINQKNGIIAAPLRIQQLESMLNMRNFIESAREVLSQPLSSGNDDDDSDIEDNSLKNLERSSSDGSANEPGLVKSKKRRKKKLLGTKEERQSFKSHIYNFNDLTSDREWLYEMLLSDSESESEISDEDEYVRELLKAHIGEQKHRENFYKKANNTQYAYYGAGMLSNHDMFPDHQQTIVGVRKRRRRTKKEKPTKMNKLLRMRMPRKKRQQLEQPEPGEIDPEDLKHYAFGDTLVENDDDDDDDDNDGDNYMDHNDDMLDVGMPDDMEESGDFNASGAHFSGRGRRRKLQMARTPEVMAARRRRVWQLMAKKEIGRCQRARVNNHKESLQNCKRVATMCMKTVRQRAMASQKVMKETVWRAKRLTREMLAYWKRYERVERDNRRRMEREAEEQRKMDVEIIEAKRQTRKLNFLITQTELYAHFMSKKLGHGTEEEQLRILNQLDEEINPRLAAYDDYDAEHMKQMAQKNAEKAFTADSAKNQQFSELFKDANNVLEKVCKQEEGEEKEAPTVKGPKDLPQPKIFQGQLKTYQVKGMTWIANLYDQGISGILADEMGLGKTVQSIAFLCHIAERYGLWGPFLIISPASTLHNWQQEMERFVPDFNVVPYWGSPNERKILRQFWEQKDLHTREASFHVVITSYQLIVSDYKYFNRIKWQYMVLDEAQAIKSSSSMRWKMLLGFNCRNRLLLSGTPIQNSMAELWALLHFIMPTLFDSHDEFNEWFSKDIESHAENKTGIDEKQISRLHMILKPFMLRRIKKDVENELSDKIEIMVYCPLTIRQKLLYMALKKKIRIEDLLHLTRAGGSTGSADHHVDKNFTSNLMNLVMQFRKVCNHPELFERRDAKSPFSMRCEEYVLPRLLFNEGLLYRSIPSKRHLLYNKFNIFKAAHVHQTMFFDDLQTTQDKNDYERFVDLSATDSCCFSFTRFCNISPQEVESTTLHGLVEFLLHYQRLLEFYKLLAYRYDWWRADYGPTRFMLLQPMLHNFQRRLGVLRKFIFTGMTTNESTFYAFGDYTTVNIQETMEHRVIRSKHLKSPHKRGLIEEMDDKDIKIEIDLEGEDSQMAASGSAKGLPKETTKSTNSMILPELPHQPRLPTLYTCEALEMPRFLYGLPPRVQAVKRRFYCESRAAEWAFIRHTQCENHKGLEVVSKGLELCRPHYGWSSIVIPDKQTLVSDAGKLAVLDSLLTRLKAQGHRVLIYSQMTKMIDLLEEYMWHRKHRYMRLDGSSKISARRDMVADFQSRADIFVFLLSTRAGGLGINLTAADTVIFYDSDWNPTVDQQAMDRAHRLGQTKQVTVYRLICKGTIEERILQRAREKSEIQRMVISGGNFKPDTLKPKEVVSLLLDDEEIELKYRQKAEHGADGANAAQQNKEGAGIDGKKKRAQNKPTSSISGGITIPASAASGETVTDSTFSKRFKADDDDSMFSTSDTSSPAGNAGGAGSSEPFVPGATTVLHNDDSDNEALIVDCDSPMHGTDSPSIFDYGGAYGRARRRHHPRGTKRGRPRGSTKRGAGNASLSRQISSPISNALPSISTASATTTITTNALDDFSQQSNSPLTNMGEGRFSPTVTPLPIKRGPGRPRLKTGGPPHQGTRGSPRTRKPIGPLVVPLGHSPAATPLTCSPTMSPARSPAHSERLSVTSATSNAD